MFGLEWEQYNLDIIYGQDIFLKYVTFSVYLALANSVSNNNNMLVFFTIPEFISFFL